MKNGAKKRAVVAECDALSAVALKASLWETLRAVKAGTMTPAQGDVVAGQAREILRCVKAQLSIFSQASKSVSRELVDFASDGR